MSLSNKKFWLRDYDLHDVQEQVRDGEHDDCVVMWAEVEKHVRNLKEKFHYMSLEEWQNFDEQKFIDEVFGCTHKSKKESSK